MDVATRNDQQVLARRIKQVQWRHHRQLDGRLRGIGSTIVQWDVLRALTADPSASAHDLAQATFQSDQSLGVMMRRMVQKGLIERSAGKGHRFVHRITDTGRTVLQAGHRFADDVFEASFQPLSAADRHELGRLLQLIATAEDHER